MIRSPAVSGQFYPAAPRELDRVVRTFTRDNAGKVPARAIVVPHTGHIYSGGVAGEVFSSVALPDRHIIFCPNHTGVGSDAAIMTRGAWGMPWGDVPIDEALASRLLETSTILVDDPSAHRGEHSLEVQLPFIHRFLETFRIVPVTLGRLSLDQCRALGEATASVLRDDPSPPLIVASSDMTHYEPDAVVRRKDQRAIARILDLDPEGLYRTVRSERITMCGVIPATVALFAAVALGATSARLVKYATSADASGDYGQVVGYAGLAIL